MLKNEQGQTRRGEGSKLGDLERTYFLNVPLCVELKTNGGVIIITILYIFIISFLWKQPTPRKVMHFFNKNLFGKCECILTDIFKFTISVLEMKF